MDKTLRIITSERCAMSFVDFITHKTNLGFSVPIVFVEALGNDPLKIKEYIVNKYHESNDQPYYLLLGGDLNIIPSFQVNYPSSGKRNRDGNYAVIINDKNKEFDVDPPIGKLICSWGRLPGCNAAEIKSMCDNIIAYESQKNHIASFLGIATTNDNCNFMNQIINSLSIPQKMFLNNIASLPSRLKGEITTQLQQYSVICYNGHGGSNNWNLKSNVYYKHTDIPDLNNHPHILSWACNTNNISQNDNLGVSFIKKRAISFLGACCKTYGNDNRIMCQNILQEYINANCPETLGELYFNTLSTHTKSRESIKYMLLGDPTLKIR